MQLKATSSQTPILRGLAAHPTVLLNGAVDHACTKTEQTNYKAQPDAQPMWTRNTKHGAAHWFCSLNGIHIEYVDTPCGWTLYVRFFAAVFVFGA